MDGPKYVTTFHPKKLYNISDHETLKLESWYILTVTKMSITSLSKVMECLDNVKICLLNRFWWRDSCNACHEIWQHHKTIFMATFQRVLLDRFMSSRCFLYLVLPPLTQCTNANKLYSNVFFYRSKIEWLHNSYSKDIFTRIKSLRRRHTYLSMFHNILDLCLSSFKHNSLLEASFNGNFLMGLVLKAGFLSIVQSYERRTFYSTK